MTKLKARAFFAMFLTSIVFLAITLSACSKPEEKKEVKQDTKKEEIGVIKIGAILPLTGPIAFFGEYEKNAINIACSEINDRGGIKGKNVEVIYEDSRNDPKEAVNAFNKLINIQKVPVVITQMSSISMALVPIADQSKIVLVSLAMHPEFAKKSKYAFRIYESVRQESEKLAEYIYANRYEKIAVVYIEDVWGEEAKAAFENKLKLLGKAISFSESYSVTNKDFKGILTKLDYQKPDAIYLAGYGPGVGIFAKQFKEIGLNSQLFGNIGMSWDYVLRIAGNSLDGAIVCMPRFLASQQANEPFVKKYLAGYGKFPNFESAFAYDAFNIIIEAINRSGYTGKEIQAGIFSIKIYSGISGEIRFDEYGDTTTDSLALRTIKNGTLKDLR